MNLIRELKYAFYLTVHPFKGFWEIKHEKQGSLKTALFIFLFFLLSSVAQGFYSGFLYNPSGGINFSVSKNVMTILITFFLWCISNWCLTSLFNGEGNFRDIFMATSYALLPLMLIQIFLIPLSNILTVQESSFYNIIKMFGILWFALLLFIGTIVTHQYSLGKTVIIIISILLGMCLITYILLLFFNLIQQMMGFIITFWKEFSLRIS